MRYVQVALWRHPINGRASAKPSGVVFVVLDDVSVAVLRVIMSLSIALRSRLASAVVSWVPNVWFRPLAEGDDLSAPPDVYLEVQHPCWSCNSNSSSANASAGVR